MKVLSINFDYFTLATKEAEYPDYPEDLRLSMSVSPWEHIYSEMNVKKEIKLNREAIKEVLACIDKQSGIKQVYVCDHQTGIYQFVSGIVEHSAESVMIYNLNMFPGTMEAGKKREITPSNWAQRMTVNGWAKKVFWCGNGCELSYKDTISKKMPFEKLLSQQYDVIFVTKDNTLVPPHMDAAYISFVKKIIDACCTSNVIIEGGALEDRYKLM